MTVNNMRNDVETDQRHHQHFIAYTARDTDFDGTARQSDGYFTEILNNKKF